MIHSEAIVYKEIVFRRYPGSRVKAHRNYYRPHSGHVSNGVQALHQEIWKDHHGAIPKGKVVHHQDGNPLNNQPNNLILITQREHLAVHRARGDWDPSSRKQLRHLKSIRGLTKAWHKSTAGWKWHSQNSKQLWKKKEVMTKACVECQKTFRTKVVSARFCSARCQGRARRKNPDQYVEKTCEVCGEKFSIFKCELSRSDRPVQRTCSRVCGWTLRSIN